MLLLCVLKGVKGGSCGAGHFRCSSGACIAESYVCDGENDCDDGLDESYCPNRRECDSSKEHRCSEGSAWKCIPRTDVCDGEKDCSDGSDEDNCPVKNACLESAGEHTCSGSSQCIPKIWVCDGEQDCEFGQDEVNCTALTPPAPESCPAGHVRCSTECVAKTVLCRSALDCVGATVEQLCFLFSAKTPAPAVQEVATPRSEPEQVVVAYSEEQEAVIDSEPAPVEPQQMIVYSEPQQIVVQPVTEPSEPEHDDSHSDLDQPLFPTEPTEPEHDDSNSDLDQPLFPTESPEQDSESGANEQPESSAEPERALFESDPDTLAEPNRALFSEPDFDRVKKPKLTPFNFTELEHELLNDNKPESDKNKKSDLPPSNSTDLGDESINATQSKSDQAKPTVEIPPIQVDAVNTIVEIAERMDIPPALVDRKGYIVNFKVIDQLANLFAL